MLKGRAHPTVTRRTSSKPNRCADGWLATVANTPAQFRSFAAALGLEAFNASNGGFVVGVGDGAAGVAAFAGARGLLAGGEARAGEGAMSASEAWRGGPRPPIDGRKAHLAVPQGPVLRNVGD